jgi:predicted Zn finger-like uncharacterized protein
VSEPQTITCPNCSASFHVSGEQLAKARGRVRCGNCLRIFDGVSGDMVFVAPDLPEGSAQDRVLDVEVKPMAAAELPESAWRSSPSAWAILLALVMLLLGQLYLPKLLGTSSQAALQLTNVVVRPHPDVENALRLDAIIRNPGERAAPLPLLVLAFSNRQGEPRARRMFFPSEYLHDSGPLRLPARSEIQVSLALADPGSDAVNYMAHIQPSTAQIY